MLLSETELRSALEPLLDRLLVERLRLFQLQLEPRLQGMIEAAVGPAAQAQAELGVAIEAMLAAREPEAVFDLLWNSSAAAAGPARALLVRRHGQMAVWRSEGLQLPPRFPASARQQWLGAGACVPIEVRGSEIGALWWNRGSAVEDHRRRELEALARAAGMALLAQALGTAEPAGGAGHETQAVPTVKTPHSGLSGRDPAARFAALLIEDLELLLRRERSAELEASRNRGETARMFAAEIERCRRAFRERFAGREDAFEEAARRLGA